MTSSYWKMVAESIARGLGPKVVGRLGQGGRFLGRAGGVLGVGFMAYELFKSYRDNIESEPAFQEMTLLQQELEKWSGAVSSIGRSPFEEKAYGSFDEGGAVNALYPKRPSSGGAPVPPSPREAADLVRRAVESIDSAENVFEDGQFESKRRDLVDRLREVEAALAEAVDYAPLQQALSDIVAEIKPIESAFSARIYDCSREIQKKLGSNAAWAALSMATLGFIKKPKG